MIKPLASALAALLVFTLSSIPASAASHQKAHHMHQMMVMVNGHMAPVMVMVNGHLMPVFIENSDVNGG